MLKLFTRVERDHLHSVIQSSRDRTNPGNNTFARTYKFLQHKVYKALQDFPRLTKDLQVSAKLCKVLQYHTHTVKEQDNFYPFQKQ